MRIKLAQPKENCICGKVGPPFSSRRGHTASLPEPGHLREQCAGGRAGARSPDTWVPLPCDLEQAAACPLHKLGPEIPALSEVSALSLLCGGQCLRPCVPSLCLERSSHRIPAGGAKHGPWAEPPPRLHGGLVHWHGSFTVAQRADCKQ